MGLDPGELRPAGPHAGCRSALPGGHGGAGRSRRPPPRAALAPAGRGGASCRRTLGGRQPGRRVRDGSRALRAGGCRATAPPRAGRRRKCADAAPRCRGRPAPGSRPRAARIHRAGAVLRRPDVRPSGPGDHGGRALPGGRARRPRAPGRRGAGGGRDRHRDRASSRRGGGMGSVRQRRHRATQGNSPRSACARAAVRPPPADRGPGRGVARRCGAGPRRILGRVRGGRSARARLRGPVPAERRAVPPGRTSSRRWRRPSGTRRRCIWRSTW